MIVGLLSSILLGVAIVSFIVGNVTFGVICIAAIVAVFVGGFLLHLFRG